MSSRCDFCDQMVEKYRYIETVVCNILNSEDDAYRFLTKPRCDKCFSLVYTCYDYNKTYDIKEIFPFVSDDYEIKFIQTGVCDTCCSIILKLSKSKSLYNFWYDSCEHSPTLSGFAVPYDSGKSRNNASILHVIVLVMDTVVMLIVNVMINFIKNIYIEVIF